MFVLMFIWLLPFLIKWMLSSNRNDHVDSDSDYDPDDLSNQVALMDYEPDVDDDELTDSQIESIVKSCLEYNEKEWVYEGVGSVNETLREALENIPHDSFGVSSNMKKYTITIQKTPQAWLRIQQFCALFCSVDLIQQTDLAESMIRHFLTTECMGLISELGLSESEYKWTLDPLYFWVERNGQSLTLDMSDLEKSAQILKRRGITQSYLDSLLKDMKQLHEWIENRILTPQHVDDFNQKWKDQVVAHVTLKDHSIILECSDVDDLVYERFESTQIGFSAFATIC